ncbi:MAG: hypothetical protein QNJ40_06880 [Xanthomonadales bacterium]|nr:hypothetical protein [Xanthomonadales bacterium]
MGRVRPCPRPAEGLLRRYAEDWTGPGQPYTDCFCLTVDAAVGLDEYVLAFYTTPLFKLERLILAVMVKRPSTDQQARELAAGARHEFAAWTVEARSEHQLLMCDFQRRTRSWFMVVREGEGSMLYFGSAVVPKPDSEGELGRSFTLLLGFHKLYSRLLLGAAGRRLRRGVR